MLLAALYHFYYKIPVPAPATVTTPASKPAAKDSLKVVPSLADTFFRASISDTSRPLGYMDAARQDVDLLKDNLESKLEDFYRLRNEIKGLLDHRDTLALTAANNQKIKELQEKIAALRFVNMDVEKENKRLNALLNQLKSERQTVKPTPPIVSRVQSAVPEKNNETGNLFLLYDLRFSAIDARGGQETETNKADQAEKLSGSFRVKTQVIDNGEAELVVMVIKPDGSILQQSAWEAGVFDTPDGKKVYSKKLRFEYNRGEPKQLRFLLEAEKLERGNYTLKIYHRGRLIGKINKILN